MSKYWKVTAYDMESRNLIVFAPTKEEAIQRALVESEEAWQKNQDYDYEATAEELKEKPQGRLVFSVYTDQEDNDYKMEHYFDPAAKEEMNHRYRRDDD